MNKTEHQPNTSNNIPNGNLIVQPTDIEALRKLIDDALASMNKAFEDQLAKIRSIVKGLPDYSKSQLVTASSLCSAMKSKGYYEIPFDCQCFIYSYSDYWRFLLNVPEDNHYKFSSRWDAYKTQNPNKTDKELMDAIDRGGSISGIFGSISGFGTSTFDTNKMNRYTVECSYYGDGGAGQNTISVSKGDHLMALNSNSYQRAITLPRGSWSEGATFLVLTPFKLLT